MTSKKNAIIKFLLSTVSVMLPGIVFAQGGGGSRLPCPPGKFCNPIAYNNFMDFVQAILEVVLKIGIPVAALAIIYSGFLFVKAQGNDQELVKAKKAFTYAVIGTAVLLGSWLLAVGIESTINSLR